MKEFFIDLGTCNTSIYDKDEGLILREPTLLAYTGEEICAVGIEAKKKLGVFDCEFSFPISEGVVVDRVATTSMLNEFMRKFTKTKRANATIICSCGITDMQRQNLFEAVSDCGFLNVSFIESARLSDNQTNAQKTNMFVDIGGGKTDFAIVRNDEILTGCTLFSGGNNVDASIKKSFSENFGQSISTLMAEKVKRTLGSFEFSDTSSMMVDGKAELTGEFRSVIANAKMINEILKEFFDRIIKVVKVLKSQVSPQVLAELQTNKIYLRGGMSKFFGISEYFTKRLSISCEVVDKPEIFRIF